MTTKADRHTAAKITPEDVAKMRMLINQPEPNTEHPWHPVADPNDFRRYLHNCGDDNPLYIDLRVRRGEPLAQRHRPADVHYHHGL